MIWTAVRLRLFIHSSQLYVLIAGAVEVDEGLGLQHGDCYQSHEFQTQTQMQHIPIISEVEERGREGLDA